MKKGQVSSTNEVGTTKILYSKKPPQFLFHNISQINMRWITDLNVKSGTLKLLEKKKNREEILLNLEIERFFRTQKTLTIKK